MEGFTRKPTYDKGQTSTTVVGANFLHEVIRYKGVFDLQELYQIIHDWLLMRGFEVHESKYKSITLPTGGKERSFDWACEKKGNEFVMITMNIHFQFQDVHPIEVMKDGEKKILNKGLMLIRVTQDVLCDFSERYAYSKFHKTLLNFMVNFFWSKKIETYWEDKTRFKSYELINLIKETMDFMTKGNEHYDVW
ncbi:MAG: hypothetical protein WC254_03100 [Candidatus Woesearchaeota archaeon]|jgi:hypothetical protein